MKGNNVLSSIERKQAKNALVKWFETQDINPKDGGLIMVELLAELLSDKVKSEDDIINVMLIQTQLMYGLMTVHLNKKKSEQK